MDAPILDRSTILNSDSSEGERVALRDMMRRVAEAARDRLSRSGQLEVELDAQREIESRVRLAIRKHAA